MGPFDIFHPVLNNTTEYDRIEIMTIVKGQMIKVCIITDEMLDDLEVYDSLYKHSTFFAFRYVEKTQKVDRERYKLSSDLWDYTVLADECEGDDVMQVIAEHGLELADIYQPLLINK